MQPQGGRSGRGYSLNLRWHLWFHMASSAGLPAGVGRATLEKGLELMAMWGTSFFRAATWLACTTPNMSRRPRRGNIWPTSLEGGQEVHVRTGL